MKLTRITSKDAEEYARLRNESDTYKWFFSAKKYSANEVRYWLETSDKVQEINLFGYVGGELVGAISLYQIDKSISKRAEVGRVMVAKSHRGRGYGTELLDRVLQVAAEEGLEELYAFIKSNNIASIKAFKSAKYQKTMDYGDRIEMFRTVEVSDRQ